MLLGQRVAFLGFLGFLGLFVTFGLLFFLFVTFGLFVAFSLVCLGGVAVFFAEHGQQA